VTIRAVLIGALILLDTITFILSFSLAILIREGVLRYFFIQLTPLESYLFYVANLWWMPLPYIFFIGYESLYTKRFSFWDETKNLIKACTLAVLVIFALFTVSKMGELVSRLVLITLWAISLVLFPSMRFYGKRILYHIGLWKERVLILGAGETGYLVQKGLERETNLGYVVIGFLDDDPAKTGTMAADKKVFGKIRHFTKFVNELKIQTIIIAIPSMPFEAYRQLISTVQKYVKHTLLIPGVKGVSLTDSTLSYLFNEELFLIDIKNNLKNPINRLIKRCFDIVLSIFLMPVLLPVILVLAVMIKLDSKGPAFFRQERLGKGGKMFKVMKFRSMYMDNARILQEYLAKNPEVAEEWEKYKKIRGEDPRVTVVGRFLRKTSMDELPQAFNVIKGEMSFIGPRPFLLNEMEYLSDCYDEITMVNPGITGLWQVSGRSDIAFADRIKLDLWYIKNWSIWLDIIILVKTVSVVLKGKGAY
jgi:undecaprenyl-phosphate galactose phosphotransferase